MADISEELVTLVGLLAKVRETSNSLTKKPESIFLRRQALEAVRLHCQGSFARALKAASEEADDNLLAYLKERDLAKASLAGYWISPGEAISHSTTDSAAFLAWLRKKKPEEAAELIKETVNPQSLKAALFRWISKGTKKIPGLAWTSKKILLVKKE